MSNDPNYSRRQILVIIHGLFIVFTFASLLTQSTKLNSVLFPQFLIINFGFFIFLAALIKRKDWVREYGITFFALQFLLFVPTLIFQIIDSAKFLNETRDLIFVATLIFPSLLSLGTLLVLLKWDTNYIYNNRKKTKLIKLAPVIAGIFFFALPLLPRFI